MDFNTPVPGIAGLEPVCPDLENSTKRTLDHLNGYHYRERLYFYRPEKGLRDVCAVFSKIRIIIISLTVKSVM
jgi:hypothetical protein